MYAGEQDRVVVCIHGLWMKRGIFWYLRNSLQQSGFSLHLFEYASIRKSFEANAHALQCYVAAIKAKQIDFIAHSLGGLLLFHYFTLTQDARLGKVVLMGTPLRGSAIAGTFAQSIVLNPLLGTNRDILQRGINTWSVPGPVMMIAGTKRIGVGRMFGNVLAVPNDGTVAVEETKHPRLYAHYEIPETHTSMLYSSQAIRLIKTFLA